MSGQICLSAVTNEIVRTCYCTSDIGGIAASTLKEINNMRPQFSGQSFFGIQQGSNSEVIDKYKFKIKLWKEVSYYIFDVAFKLE